MTKKDTILIGVIVNACLLAVLFLTAFIYDSEEMVEKKLTGNPVVATAPVPVELTVPSVPVVMTTEVAPASAPSFLVSSPVPVEVIVPPKEELFSFVNEVQEPKKTLEIVVKKGDSLDKIAREHKTTVTAIKQLNQLQNNNLSIGKILKIPASSPKSSVTEIAVVETHQPVSSLEPVFYTVKAGDSPWKIARQNNVSVEDILRLNHLNEEKARNLKIGDRIRVR